MLSNKVSSLVPASSGVGHSDVRLQCTWATLCAAARLFATFQLRRSPAAAR